MSARRRLADVARGLVPADLVLRNGRVFDDLTGEFVPADLAIFGDTIAGIGAYRGLQNLDVRGRIILPGFLDAFAMLEPSLLTLTEYARTVAVHGTTAAVFDYRGIAGILGLQGVIALLEEGRRAAVDVFCSAPLWCGESWDTVPTRFEALDPTLLSLPGLVAKGGHLLGQALLESTGDALDDSRFDIHLPAIVEAPGASEQEAAALAALGVAADHDWESPDEALIKLRQGLWLLAAEGSLSSSVADLKWLARTVPLLHCCLVSGACTATDLLADGHLDAALGRAVRAGIPAAEAIRMVTSRPATFFGLRDRGVLAPGYRADLAVVDDVRSFHVNLVVRGGRPVARQGESLLPAPPPLPTPNTGRMQVAPVLPNCLVIHGHGGLCRVIGLEADGSTVIREEALPQADGSLQTDPARDLCKVVVIERHTASGRVGRGFVHGLGLQRGALCCSLAGAGCNLIAAGVDDDSILLAIQQVITDGGGIAVAAEGRVTACLPLPYAGLLSPLPASLVAAALEQLDDAAWDLGWRSSHPYLDLAALADTRHGELRITERGLVDVRRRRVVALQE